MRFQLHGVRTSSVFIEVEADSEDEAIDYAEDAGDHQIDTWDTETNWFSIIQVD